MTLLSGTRNIGIIGDGSNDHDIIEHVVKCILSNDDPINVFPLRRFKLRDEIDRYWRSAKDDEDYCLSSSPASSLQKHIAGVLVRAFEDFMRAAGLISCNDILIVTSDAERSLNSRETYLNTWAFSIPMILASAVEKFYHIMAGRGYAYDVLPLIVPLITFPSIEVLIAAARKTDHYGKSARSLKFELYGAGSSPRQEVFEEKALNFIIPENIPHIFNRVPESRLFIQTLYFGKNRR